MSETKRTSSRKRKPVQSVQSEEAKSSCHNGQDSKKPKTTEPSTPVMKALMEEDIHFHAASVPKRNAKGELVFEDHPEFRPNLTPEEVIRRGSFGGTYFRPIDSSVAKRSFTSEEAMEGLPASWFTGIDMDTRVTSNKYRTAVNAYKVSCGQGLREWESSGWITPYDPYGWFQWYCHFYLGRRCPDDARQIKRGCGVMGDKGRWRRFLANKCIQATSASHPLEQVLEDASISPKVRQLLQHWGYAITLDALKLAKKMRK